MDDHDASYYRVGNTPGWKRTEAGKPKCSMCGAEASHHRGSNLRCQVCFDEKRAAALHFDNIDIAKWWKPIEAALDPQHVLAADTIVCNDMPPPTNCGTCGRPLSQMFMELDGQTRCMDCATKAGWWEPMEAEPEPKCLRCRKADASYQCDGVYLCKACFQATVKVPPYSGPTVWVEPQKQIAPPEDYGILPFLLGLACGIIGGILAVAVMG